MEKHDVFKVIAAQARKGELAFSTSAQVAMKVQQMLSDPDCHVEVAAKLIQAEPLLAARVVATANSAAYNRSGREIVDVRAAVTRLGFRTVRSLATALVTRQLAVGKTASAYSGLATRLWEHTAHVASLAHVIARHITKQDSEAAMFAGIVHEVGGFYLLAKAGEFPGVLDDGFYEWNEFGEAEVGQVLLEVLKVPEPVMTAMRGYWDGFLGMPPASMSDTLLLAEELAPIASPLRDADPDGEGQGMRAQIEVTLGQETLSSILAESAEEVSSLTAALRF